MAKIKEDRQISDVQIRKNAEAAGTIKKLQHELEVLRRQSDENNVASFKEKDILRGELKKKDAKQLDLQKELKDTKIANTELEARLKDKTEMEVRLQEENENLKRIINEEKEPIDEMRKKLVEVMKSHFGKFADCFLPTNDKIESREGSSGSGSNQQNPPTLTGVFLELQKVLDGLDLNRGSPEAGSTQQMGGVGNGYSASAIRAFESTEPRNLESTKGSLGSSFKQQNSPSLISAFLELQKTLDGLDLNGASPAADNLEQMGGGGNGYSASAARPFETTEPRNMEPSFGLNRPAEPTVPQPIGRSLHKIAFPSGPHRVAISQPGDIVSINPVATHELYLGAPEVSISQTSQTNKSKNNLKEEHNLTPEELNDDQVKI